MTPEELIARGQRMSAFLNDEVVTDAFEELAKAYHELWLGTDIRDIETREKMFRMTITLKDLKNELHKIVSNGKFETEKRNPFFEN